MILTIFYHKCMGKGVILEGKSECVIEIIRYYYYEQNDGNEKNSF